MTTRDWEEKMRVIQELEKAKIQLSRAEWAGMYEQAMAALEIKTKAATFPVKFRSRPILPEPDFSLEEIEQAQTIIKEL